MLDLDLTRDRPPPADTFDISLDRHPCAVTDLAGVTRMYVDGSEAAKDWPKGTVHRQRGGYFEVSRMSPNPRGEVGLPPPLRTGPFWQESLMDEMYVRLNRVDIRGPAPPALPKAEGAL